MAATGLLEELAEQAGCLYLSELRDSGCFAKARGCIRKLRPEDYPVGQWNEAVLYLLGHEVCFSTPREAWAYLCESWV